MKRSTAAFLGLVAAACSTEATAPKDFYTSGSRDADQRADQRISGVEQIRGEGEGTSGAEKGGKAPLFERLGGEKGVRAIVDDFVERVLADPRVNWRRQGVRRGGVLGVGTEPAEWHAYPEEVARLKERLAQFVAVATGGPTRYAGRDMRTLHAGMAVANAEFDAAIGDLKASLDRLRIATAEQKELIAVMESTRPQVSEER